MKRSGLALVPALLLAVAPFLPVTAAPGGGSKAPDRFGDPVLLALGDSVAAGFPTGTGYPERLRELLSDGYHPAAGKLTPGRTTEFELVEVSANGARTADLAGQVDAAVALIEQRQSDRDPKNDVEVVTLTIGGNDVFRPLLAACVLATPPVHCDPVAEAGIAQVQTAVTEALARLAAAAGKHTEIVLTTYFNSLGSCPLVGSDPRKQAAAPLIADVVLEGGSFGGFLSLDVGLNDALRAAAADAGVQVAELYGALGSGELIGDCLHPSGAGHVTIAEALHATLAR